MSSDAPKSFIQIVKQETQDTVEVVAERKVYTWKAFQGAIRELREIMASMDDNRLAIQVTEDKVMTDV